MHFLKCEDPELSCQGPSPENHRGVHSPWAAVLVSTACHQLPPAPQHSDSSSLTPLPAPVTHFNSERHSFAGSLTNGSQLMSINLISLNS